MKIFLRLNLFYNLNALSNDFWTFKCAQYGIF